MRVQYVAALVCVGLTGCKPAPQADSKPQPPASVPLIAKEEALTSVVLSAEAEQRLGIAIAEATPRKMQRNRTFAGELILTLGQTGLAGSTNNFHSIYSLLPVVTPAEMARLAELQVEAEGQVAVADVQLEAARVALRRAESMLMEKAGSVRGVDEARSQVALAERALETARLRRGLLGSPLFETVKRDRLWVRVPVYVGEVPNLRTNAVARLGSLGSRTNGFTRVAKPVAVPISTSSGAATVDLYYEAENQNGELRPGAKVAVQIPLEEQEEQLMIPAGSLIHDIYGGSWVYERTGTRAFTRRRVEVRFIAEGEAAIGRGLAAGARIVTAGAAELFGTEFGFAK